MKTLATPIRSIPIRSIWLMVLLWSYMMSAVSADQCLDPSPSIAAGKKLSDNISVRELTDTEYQQVKELLSTLNGDWKGDATEIRCNMMDVNDQDVGQYAVKADAKYHRSANLLIDAELKSAKQRTTHQETLRFYLTDKLLRINHDTGMGDVELIEVNENGFELRHRSRVQNAGNAGGIYNEFFYRLEAESGSLSVFRKIYTQGRLSSKYAWRLRRN